jgi:NADH-quinone oxidoreductase subunit G
MPEPPAPVSITLDGRPVTAKAGEMLIAAAERAGTYIPRFCYHPRMKPVGMCRMCLVEVKGPRGFSLQPACFVPVTEGMEVVTTSPPVKKAQDGVLEFLLINHPLDCPVCDRGGECPLQDQTLAYGPGETRFVEEKRHWDKPTPISPLILIDRERCIQCARCTRFADEVAGEAGIDLASRSDSTEVAIYPKAPYTSNFSGNVVQICPVGALLAKPYRFKARPWDLEQVETTCTLCAVGCRVAAQSSQEEVVRFLGVDSDPVNWGWLCDKGRFCLEALNSPARLAEPLVRRPSVTGNGGGQAQARLEEAGWSEALSLVAARLKGADPGRVGFIGGARLPNEDAYAWAKFARAVVGTDNVDAQLGDGLPADLVAGLPRATIDEACRAAAVVLVAPDVKEELPVLYLRLRHAAVEKGVPLVEVSPAPTGLTPYSAHSLRYRPGELAAVVKALCQTSTVSVDVGGVPAGDLEAARRLMQGASSGEPGGSAPPGEPRLAVVLGRPSLAEAPAGAAQAALALAGLPGTAFLPALRRSNVHGAIDLGLAPGLLPGRVSLAEGRSWFAHHWGAPLPAQPGLSALGMLERAAEGRMDALILIGADPVSDFPDKALAALALERAGFVVAVDAFLTMSAAQADVVLPAAIYTERRGSFTNIEGRVTWLAQKVVPPGTARPDWMIAADLASRMGHDLGARSLGDLWSEIEKVSPLYAGVSQQMLRSYQGRDGVVVPVQATGAAPARVPAPLDPMENPGIHSAEPHPVPATALDHQRAAFDHQTAALDRVATAEPASPPEGRAAPEAPAPPRRLSLADLAPAGAPSPPAPKRAGQGPPATPALPPGAAPFRLVAMRPMWDGGTLVQESPSVQGLHPALVASLHPEDLASLGAAATGMKVRLRSARGSLVLPARADAGVPPGTVVVPFNLPPGGAGELVDAAADWTEVAAELVAEEAVGSR